MPFKNLPDAANQLWEKVYNASKKAGDSEEIAAKKAWAAVSRGWKKDGETWVKKSEGLVELSMHFTAAPFDKGTSEMRWKAVASDTDRDIYDESMSPELYQSFLDNITHNRKPPVSFRSYITSNFWEGGMPYLSVSHYTDLNGDGVPGPVDAVYMDGKCLKAKGRFDDTPLGRACWKSLNKDMSGQVPDNKKIRISIAFLDLAHRHGDGPVFERKSSTDTCYECLLGVGDKTYVKGYLVHLAMTRVPVNPRAEMEVEKSMDPITRKEDAASIVGEDEATELEQKSALVGRSEAMVERADMPMEEDDAKDKKKKKDEETCTKSEAVVEVAPAPAPALPETSDPNPVEPEEIPFAQEVKDLNEVVKSIVTRPEMTREARLEAIRPAIESFGAAVERALVGNLPEPTVPPVTLEVVRSIVQEATQPIQETLLNIQASLQNVAVQKSEVQTTIPKPRSPDPMIVRNLVAKATGTAKPGSIRDICRRSVGISD